jgi:hypothetical protein
MNEIAGMDIPCRHQEAEEKRQTLNDLADENMKILLLKFQQLHCPLTEVQRHFLWAAIEHEVMRGAEKILCQLGLEDGKDLVRIMTPRGMGNLILTAVKSEDAGQHYWVHFDPGTGQLFSGDHQTGQVTHWALVDPNTPTEKRVQARNQMLAEYKRAGTGMSHESFDDYVASPQGRAHEALLLGNIDRGQYDRLCQQFAREAKEDQEEARALRRFSRGNIVVILIEAIMRLLKKAFGVVR